MRRDVSLFITSHFVPRGKNDRHAPKKKKKSKQAQFLLFRRLKYLIRDDLINFRLKYGRDTHSHRGVLRAEEKMCDAALELTSRAGKGHYDVMTLVRVTTL